MYADAIEQQKLNDVTMYLHYNNDVHDVQDQNPETPGNNRYSITGTAWLDSNQNGQRDENETLLSDIEVLLLDKQTSQIVQDIDTKQNKTTTTNGNGYYQFTNLVSDEYLVVFLYDSGRYSITEYQKQDVNTNFNNDAISMKVILNGEQRNAGVTDTIRVTNQNQRNIDIGLYTSEKFDMRLDKYVTEITLTTPTIGTNTYTYGDSQLERVEILAQNVNKSNIIIKYKIVVTNEGQIPGYVRKIIDYLPEGASFNSEINQDWYISDNNRTVLNTSLENTNKPRRK
ncbi:MAG: SdrD B-like domain-containing protein [Intestinibacter sp.]